LKRKSTIIALIVAGMAVSFFPGACRKKDVGSNFQITPLTPDQPAGFPNPVYNFADNPLTEEGFQLGRHLFYDGRLSKDGNFPCASCHQQFAAFATFDHNLSHGFDNSFTTRNAPGTFNMTWQKEMHADGSIANLEIQALSPITATNEMAESIDNVISKLQATTKYPTLFKSAFGDEKITTERILKALAQFTGSIVSADSKYDRVKKGTASFDAYEQHGYAIFQQHCETCHPEPMFTDFSYRNTGQALDPILQDKGRMRVTHSPADSLKFKVPSLRNVNVTFPYLHDGRIYGLTETVKRYRVDRLIQSSTLDPLLINGINLSDEDVSDVVSFLRTLTDSTLLSNPRFSQPTD